MKELYILKHKYGISMQAIAKRAFDLEIITDKAYKRLYIQFSKNGWRKRAWNSIPGRTIISVYVAGSAGSGRELN